MTGLLREVVGIVANERSWIDTLGVRGWADRRIRHAGISIVWKLPPRVIYWCVIRATVQNCADNETPGDLAVSTILKRMDGKDD